MCVCVCVCVCMCSCNAFQEQINSFVDSLMVTPGSVVLLNQLMPSDVG